MNKLLYTQYLNQLHNYVHQAPEKKAFILLGYIERDFIQYYRQGELEAGIAFLRENLLRNRELMGALTVTQRITHLHIMVDDLAHEGIQNHVEINPFLDLQHRYHQLLRGELDATFLDWMIRIIRDFDALMHVDGLSFTSRLESTLDIIYFVNAHLYNKITVREVLKHVNRFCNPARAQRNFSQEMNMSISDFIMVQRMREAQRLLIMTEDAVQDIAQRLGFYDLNDFSRRFKRKVGVSPLAYRQKYA